MKNEKYILIAVILVVLLGVCLYFAFSKDKDVKELDGEKFAKEYTEVLEDNVFIYKSAEEVIKVLKDGTGVVYLGFPECPWCQAYVKYLNDVAKEVGIEKIYYFNILEDRKNNTENYKEIVSLLEGHLQHDDDGNSRVYVPNVSFVVDGEIIGNDYETSKDTHDLKDPKEYWTEDEVDDLKNTLTSYMEKVFKATNMCTDCNK